MPAWSAGRCRLQPIACKWLNRRTGWRAFALTRLFPAEGKLAFAKLLQFSGINFDMACMGVNVSNHEKAVSDFKQESTQEANPDIKTFTADTLPILVMHLTLAQQIATMIGILQ